MFNLFVFFNVQILKILFKIIVKIFNPFKFKIYLFIIPYNDRTTVFCIGVIVKLNWNKVWKKNILKNVNLLTTNVSHHIETSKLIGNLNQLTGTYMVVNGLTIITIFYLPRRSPYTSDFVKRVKYINHWKEKHI